MKGVSVISLFDGISCGMVALEREKIPVRRYVAYEVEPNAIEVSKKNYPQIEQCGNVFNAKCKNGEFDILLGGSPCTHWSVARTRGGRETTSSGIGWELFMQYVRILREGNPKYFIYENNFSINKNIKDEITKELGVEPLMINSALVSGQSRERMYWTNIPNVVLPSDKGILLPDVVDFSKHEFRDVGKWAFEYWRGKRKIDGLKTVTSNKSHTLTTSKTHPMNYYLNENRTKYCNLSVNDWEALQTLPDGYVEKVDISQGAKFKCIGNGWTVDVIAHILSFVKKEEP